MNTAGVKGPVRLRCEYESDPMGIDERRPRFSWVVNDDRRGAVQSAYRIVVEKEGGNGAADVWDSGRVESTRSVNVEYEGPEPEAAARYAWRVKTWDGEGKESPWSDTAWWETGLLERGNWGAEWIGMDFDETPPPAAYVRREFELRAPIKRARAYVTAMGSYRLMLNGRRVGDDVLAPVWTDYRKRVTYRTHDVTGLVQEGGNAAGAILGDGWCLGALSWAMARNCFGDPPARLLLRLEVTYEDGGKEAVVSDGTWKCSTGPIIRSGIYEGEVYDARFEMPGWDAAGFDDSSWSDVRVVEDTGVDVVAQTGPSIRVTREVAPVSVKGTPGGAYIYDLGQNMAGFCRLRVEGPAGTRVQLRHAEILNPDGSIYTENLRKAEATDAYILKGEGVEEYTPHFTYHGFRYVEVTGYPGEPDIGAITGLAAHSDVAESGKLECSSELVNRILGNVVWGLVSNLYSVPTDCPQRDERLGWMGDAQLFCRTSCYLKDMASFYTKWEQDIVDAQRETGAFTDVCPFPDKIGLPQTGAPAWMDAGVVVPWTVYEMYGDRRIIERNFGAMAKYVDFVADRNPDGIWRNERGNDYGDWVPAGVETDKTMVATLFYFQSARLVSEAAGVLGQEAEKARYEELAWRIREAFNGEYLSEGRYRDSTQTVNALAIGMGVVPEEAAASVAEDLVKDIEARDRHLSTGFLGTGFLLQALSTSGHGDVAKRLLLNTTYPSWGYMAEQGATTVWERWNSDTMGPGMNSRNHFAFGAVAEWMFTNLAGIGPAPGTAGFEKIVFRPEPWGCGGELKHVAASYESVRGTIGCEWRCVDGRLEVTVTVPPNSEAVVTLPADSPGGVTESGQAAVSAAGVRGVSGGGGQVNVEVGSGTYEFAVAIKEP
ncbi:MAG: family 78 glycoside hydrolase catalytic domain [Planctomycetes bacterium]|nr:family 78 glycoside hydrolase catalytic domain [Planctomycetota bacterium]